MKTRSVCILLVVLGIGGQTRGDDIEAFRNKYMKAAEKARVDYANMVVQGTLSHHDGEDKLRFTDDTTLYVSGGKAMWTATRKEVVDGDLDHPVGSFMVRGGTKEMFVSATRKPGEKEFVVSEAGPITEDRFLGTIRTRCFAAFAPFIVLDQTLSDVFSSEAYAIKSVDETKLDVGESVLKVLIEAKDPKNPGAKSFEVLLEPDSLAIREYTVNHGGMLSRGRASYVDKTSPRQVKTVEKWTEQPGSKVKINRLRFDASSVKFEKPPEEKFTPAGVGLPEAPVRPLKEPVCTP